MQNAPADAAVSGESEAFLWRPKLTRFITALHVMQTRYSDENSVCPSARLSVRLSVCNTRDP